jgi:hypothetical protein
MFYDLDELEKHIERVNVAGEPGSEEEFFPVQPALSEREIDAATRAAMTASMAMRQEIMDAPPALDLDLAQEGWWGTLRAFYAQCQAAGRCLGYNAPRRRPALPGTVVAAYEELARELGHACCECPCGQFREWVLTLTDPKTARIGVADIAAWGASMCAAWVREQSYAWLSARNPEEAAERYSMGLQADQAEYDAIRTLALVSWERRYANASDDERRKMVERKADAFDRVPEAYRLSKSSGHLVDL